MDRRIKRSRAQEKEGAARWGGTQHSGSGNGWARKNDISTTRHQVDRALLLGDLVEFKDTSSLKSISLKVEDLVGVEQNAAVLGKRPVLGFHLAGRDYVVLLDSDYHDIRHALGESQE